LRCAACVPPQAATNPTRITATPRVR
jgi:hypothetical protein